MRQAYDLLKVKPGSSWEDIKKAYFEQIQKNHPDKTSHLSEAIQASATEQSKRLNEALETLKKEIGR